MKSAWWLGVGALAIGAVLVGASCKVEVADSADGKPDPDLPEAKKGKQGPPAYQVGGFDIQVPEMTLQPGEESYPCFIAPLSLMGPSHVVGGGSLTTDPGLHHGNITARPIAPEDAGKGFRECPPEQGQIAGEAIDVSKGGSVLFGSSTQVVGTEWRTFPDGMGFPIGDDFEIVMRLHYLNATPDPITLAPKYQWFTIDETKVTHLLGPFIWQFGGFHIPAHSELTVTGECNVLAPMNIVSLMPHMHKLATGFDAVFRGGELDQKPFLDSPGYNPDGVIASYEPAVDLTQGTGKIDAGVGFDFSCSWNNTFDKEIVEGTGDNEMCMAFGYAYPYETAYSAIAAEGSCLVIPPPYPKGFQPKN
jgi:hypothetical protein